MSEFKKRPTESFGTRIYKYKNTPKKDLTDLLPSEQIALFTFNKCCMKVAPDDNKEIFMNTYPPDLGGDTKLRLTALNLFFKSTENNNHHEELLNALIKLRPHWKNLFLKENGKNIHTKIRDFFIKNAIPTDISELGIHSSIVPGWYYKSPTSRLMGKEKAELERCLIHTSRKCAKRINAGLCQSCVAKLRRLELENYPLDLGLIYVLKTRINKTNNPIKFCVNHHSKIALGNGLCESCNRSVNRLARVLGKIGLEKEMIEHDLELIKAIR
uniref:Uncharacterized protein n=1 Tax=viral metagenome TaxID=1070528 RepID=A0A6M3KAX4_9ZZZZ